MPSPLHRQCARMFMVGFSGRDVDPELGQLLDAGVFGAIFLAGIFGGPKSVVDLCPRFKDRANGSSALRGAQKAARRARLKGAALPPMRELGLRGDPALVERCGRLLAFELRAVGFDWDFAPVLDVDTNPQNPVIGDRSLHRDAAEVARLGIALARGLERGGICS